jgi:hypothetical protein
MWDSVVGPLADRDEFQVLRLVLKMLGHEGLHPMARSTGRRWE